MGIDLIATPSISIALSINKNLFDFVKQQYPEIDSCKDGQAISLYIYNHSLSKLCLLLLEMLKRPSFNGCFFYKTCLLQSELDSFSHNQIIQHVVRLEYEAREQNKAMLLRGSGLMDMNVSMGEQPVKKLLVGSTLYKESDWLSSGQEEIPFWKKYKEKNNLSYSISFGTSLFAGMLNDPGACAYVFLSGCDMGNASMDAQLSVKPVGYALFLNKKDYVEHQNNNLFYLPSLGTLPSLFAAGEWFHARAKAVIHTNKEKNIYVKGIFDEPIWDSTGVILITRDPLKHAELFSNFLVQNGRLIQPGDVSLLIEAKKDFVDDVLKAQAEAASLYKTVKTITPKIEKATKKFKTTRDKKFENWMQDFQGL